MRSLLQPMLYQYYQLVADGNTDSPEGVAVSRLSSGVLEVIASISTADSIAKLLPKAL